MKDADLALTVSQAVGCRLSLARRPGAAPAGASRPAPASSLQLGLVCARLRDSGLVRELCEPPSYLKQGFFLRNAFGLFRKLEASLDERL